MICENCGKEHDGKYGTGRFCCRACSNTRSHSPEQRLKASKSLKKTYERMKREGRACEKCGNIYHSADSSRKLCFDCLPRTIKRAKVKRKPKSIYDISKRTIAKIFRRMALPCSCCGIFIDKSVVFDLHHIISRKNGGSDNMDNLTYICPNCHRVAHTNTSLLPKPLIPISEFLEQQGKDWKDFYYGVLKDNAMK